MLIHESDVVEVGEVLDDSLRLPEDAVELLVLCLGWKLLQQRLGHLLLEVILDAASEHPAFLDSDIGFVVLALSYFFYHNKCLLSVKAFDFCLARAHDIVLLALEPVVIIVAVPGALFLRLAL